MFSIMLGRLEAAARPRTTGAEP